MEQLKRAVEEAELVLVGIGEEMDTGLCEMRKSEPFAAFLKEIDEKRELEWLIPYLFSQYLMQTSDERRRRAYQNLGCLLLDKNYFVVTTCMDGRIGESGLLADRVTAPCGGYRKLQCSNGCRNSLQDAAETVQRVWETCLQEQGRLETVERPVCTECKQPFLMNHIQEEYQEEGYLSQWERYTKWLQGTLNKKLCVLELGVGMKYPTVIRWPFEKVAFFNQKASFFRVHHNLYQLSEQLSTKGVSIPENSLDFMENKL